VAELYVRSANGQIIKLKLVADGDAFTLATAGEVTIENLVLDEGTAHIGEVSLTAAVTGYLQTLAGAVTGTTVKVLQSTSLLTTFSDMLTALQALAGTITSAQLKVLLQAGTNVFGKLAANSGVIIGAVEGAPPTAGFSGQFTVAAAATAVQLNGGTSQAIRDGVDIACDATNTGHLLVRWATGSGATNGRRVYPGMSAFVAIDNINKVWVDASVNGATGSWSAT
jgi:hypothetical protein